jgi:hypothetical protein
LFPTAPENIVIKEMFFQLYILIYEINFHVPRPQQTGMGENKGNGKVALGGHIGDAVYAGPCISKSSSGFNSNLY